MKTRLQKIIALLFFAAAVLGCAGSGGGRGPAYPVPTAKHIILFIGDGMGVGHRTAARWSAVGVNGRLSMDAMPARGMIRTRSADHAVTDSAAAATAMATGVKTNNGVIGLDADLDYVPTILEDAIAQGKSVGLVTTTPVAHATPAAFAAHIRDRNLMTQIAAQMLFTEPDVLLGGGEAEFLPSTEIGCFSAAGTREDGRDLIDEAIAVGYTYVCRPDDFDSVDPASTDKLIGLFSVAGMPRPFRPSLAAMTRKSIEILSKNPKGFFLMVESGQIDWASHGNDADHAIADTLQLDSAVEKAKQFAARAPDTLIIVTADHETGGMTVTTVSSGRSGEDGPFSMAGGGSFYVNWTTTGHTAADVPVTSQGPHSEELTGTEENTHIYDVMISAFCGRKSGLDSGQIGRLGVGIR